MKRIRDPSNLIIAVSVVSHDSTVGMLVGITLWLLLAARGVTRSFEELGFLIVVCGLIGLVVGVGRTIIRQKGRDMEMLERDLTHRPDTQSVKGLGLTTAEANGDLEEILHPREQEDSKLEEEDEEGQED